ncbi:MAG TPA: efflux RND transporter periplasmic adaptor subunit [Pyrinomonadaceae bacterium]|nr:efflux RND transporter periplasmic adaptor subunit [Chloracidobacterium sp.]HQX56817.1 efflux RND transporter periplasmic adaptor subunit [Pyrinomonadaceae bacterium]HQZ97472.1 efflux RND transporter periplasmic adaptor subunit [Pyrinomonadaceae bacterium]
MREEINEDIVDGVEPGKVAASTPNRKPLYVASGAVGIVLLGALGFWYLSTSEGGKAVPPPRSVSFGDNTSTEPSQTASEETITIPEDQLEKIGLKIETVGETLSGEAMSLSATGVVQPNAYKETPVISLLGGVVRKVSAELGSSVGRGQTVAVIFSNELAAAQSRYLALQTEAQTASQNYDRTAKLVRISPVSNTELDQALAALTTAEAELEEHHKHHARTTKLLEIGAASREEFEMATTRLRTSEANVTAAKNRYARAVQVAEINPVSRSEFEQAAVKRQTAESDLATARQRLQLFGLSSQKVNSLRAPSQITSEIALTAPVSGTVTKRSINEGEVVEANKELMRVTNLSSVWVIAQVYEKDFGLLREGSGASVTSNAFPGQVFRGHVTYIDPNIVPETRTAQVRIELDNPGQVLKVGMYVNVAFGSMGTAERTMPTIPVAAVQNMNDKQVVFVTTGKPNVFIVRPVRLGSENQGVFLVLEGLNVGDKIATEGSFLLRAEFLKQNLEH